MSLKINPAFFIPLVFIFYCNLFQPPPVPVQKPLHDIDLYLFQNHFYLGKMKGSIIMSFLLAGSIVGGVYAQSSVPLVQTKYSKKAVRLVLKNMGKKVGSGTSLALLSLYEQKSNARTALKFSLSKKTLAYVSVGDELYFSGTYKNTNVDNASESIYEYSGPMHYAIVVGKKNDNTLMIAHQNIKEGDPKKAVLLVTELKVEDVKRYENINVYGLCPKKKGFKPEKILKTGGKVYEIVPETHEKNNYLVGANSTR